MYAFRNQLSEHNFLTNTETSFDKKILKNDNAARYANKLGSDFVEGLGIVCVLKSTICNKKSK